MKQYLLLIWIVSILAHHVQSVYTDNNTVYASEGETVILKCKVYSNNKSTWYKIESNDSKEYQTITPYADGKEINPGLPNEQNLAIIGNINEGDYNLQIQHVSSNDEGVYICSRTRNGTDVQEFNITLKMTVLPKDIKILNSKNGILEGEENKLSNLTCIVHRGIPVETITWYSSSNQIKTGGPGILSLMIITTRDNHNKQYTCKVDSYTLIKPLQESITLDIKYKPLISIDNQNPIKVTEYKNLTISCTADGNPVVQRMWIENVSKQVRHHCAAPTCRLKILEINRENAGLYRCKASNSIGTEEKTTLVIVLYPPSVTITKNKNGTVLQCRPNGNPNNYIFHFWEHRSEFGEIVRTLDNTPNLNLLVDKNYYQFTGVYICRVENGVTDINGTTLREGEFKVRFADKPVFVSQNGVTQYGRLGHPIDIKVYVYSFPAITSIQVLINGVDNFGNDRYVLTENLTITDTIFNKKVRLSGYEIKVQRFNLTRKDFAFYMFNVTNKIGHTVFNVVLTESGADTLRYIAGSSWVIFGSVIGGLLICCIGSHIVCVLIRKRKSNVVLEIFPGQVYDEIGTINHNNTIFQPTANYEEENIDDTSAITQNNNIQISIETESSDQSSVCSQSDFRQTPDEDYENPYEPINLAGIDMHSYSLIVSEHYQNTTIFPNSLANKTTEDLLSVDYVRKPWVIIYKRSKELT